MWREYQHQNTRFEFMSFELLHTNKDIWRYFNLLQPSAKVSTFTFFNKNYACFSLSSAPNLKGRPRKKKPSNSLYCDSQGQTGRLEAKGNCQMSVSSKETEATAGETTVKVQIITSIDSILVVIALICALSDASDTEVNVYTFLCATLVYFFFFQVTADQAGSSKHKTSNCSDRRNHGRQTTTLVLSAERRRRGQGVQHRAEEQAFLVALYKYMKERKTPIERIPYLGFKQSKWPHIFSDPVVINWNLTLKQREMKAVTHLCVDIIYSNMSAFLLCLNDS